MKLNLSDEYKSPIHDSLWLTPGTYHAVVDRIDMAGPGFDKQYLKVTLVCVSGESEGRSTTTFIILKHPSAKAVQFGYRKLKSLAVAVGHKDPNNIQDSDELVGAVVKVELKRRPGTDFFDTEFSRPDLVMPRGPEALAVAQRPPNSAGPPVDNYDDIPF